MLCMSLGLVSQGTVCEDPSRTRCCRSPCLWSSSLDPATFHHLCPHTGLWPQNSLRLLEETPPPALPCSLNPLPITDAEKLIGQVKQICKMCNWGLAPLPSSSILSLLSSSFSDLTSHEEFPYHCELCWCRGTSAFIFCFCFCFGWGAIATQLFLKSPFS